MLIESPQGKISVHHNLFASNYDRNPSVQSGNVEISNNIVYDWGIHPTNISGGKANVMGNKYLKSSASSVWVGPSVTGIHCEGTPQNIYVSGNVGPGGNDLDTVACTGSLKSQVFSTSQLSFAGSGLVSSSPDEAYTDVLAEAGSNKRDSVDERALSHVAGSSSNSSWIIDSQSEVGGWPNYNYGTSLLDSDNDGVPDGWELSHGLNPDNSTDAGSTSQSGYTWIEEYINSYFGETVVVPTPNYNIADINQDGAVDISDFNEVVSNFNLNGLFGWIRSDIIKNGLIDIFDFNRVLSNYGQ